MELPRDPRFLAEVEAFGLRFECEDCGLFDAIRGCAHGYPTVRHRRATTLDDPKVVFCKDFEILG